jgi:hypothetical protein
MSKKKIENIYIFILVLIFLFPNGGSYYFNGMPLNSFSENLFFIVFLLFFILTKNLIINKIIKSFIFFTFLIKIFLVFIPPLGINYNQYFDEKKEIIKTYDTIWSNGYSSVQRFPWLNNSNFPVDWTVQSSINYDEKNNRRINNYEDLKKINVNYEINSNLILNEKSEILFKTSAKDDSEITITDHKKKTIKIPLNQKILIDKGNYLLEGKLFFSGESWIFDPIIIKKNNSLSLIKNKNLFTNKINLNYYIFSFLFEAFDYLIITIFILLFYFFLKKNYENNKNILVLSFFLLIIYFLNNQIFLLIFDQSDFFDSGFVYYFISKLIQFNDINGRLSLSLTILILIFLLFFLKQNILKKIILPKNFFLILYPIFAFFFFYKLSFHLQSFTWWETGEDWTQFQTYARDIAVNGDWLVAGEEVFRFRPGIRYVFAILHIIFGMSCFVQIYLESFCVVGTCVFLAPILQTLRINIRLSILASLILLFIYFTTNFRWVIGRGLTEYFAVFLLIYSIYFCYNLNLKNKSSLIFLSLMGIVGTWLREDHIFVILSVIFFNKNFQNYVDKNFFVKILKIIKNNFKEISIYTLIVLIGLSLLFIRNYLIGGRLGLSHPNIGEQGWVRDNFAIWYRMFMATEPIPYNSSLSFIDKISNSFFNHVYKPNYLFTLISVSSLIGLIIMIIKPQKYYQPSIIVSYFSCLIPFIFFQNLGYPPRYVIYFAPFAVIAFIYIVNHVIFIILKDHIKTISNSLETNL